MNTTNNRIKLTVSLTETDIKRIENIALELHITKTEAIRRSLALQELYMKNTRDGSKFIIEDPDMKQRIIIML